jgi:hypothetical protein
MWKEAVVVYFNALSEHLFRENEENHETLSGKPTSGPRSEAETS